MNIYIYFLFVFLIVFFEISAQFMLKKKFILILPVIFYAFIAYFLSYIIDFHNLIFVNITWHLIHFFVIFLIGLFVFNEKYNLYSIFALIFGIISIILFIYSGIH